MTTFMGVAGRAYPTRGSIYSADVNGMIYNVPVGGWDNIDLVDAGCVPVVAVPTANYRNLLDGGDFTINPFQRNVPGLASSNVIANAIGNTVTYFADRWFAVGGVSSAVLMASVANTAIPGFSRALRLTRQASNTDTTTISFGQVLETADCIRLQGQTVTLSFYAAADANYSGGALSVQVITGAGSNQSAAAMVAGSWMAQANAINKTQTLTTAMTRYQFSGTIPTSATQVGVLLQWTPSGAAGTADGIDFIGIQFEIGSVASPFEFRDVQVELEICQRYAWVIPEPAAGVVVGIGGNVTGANSQTFYLATPVQLRTAPTVTVSAGSFQVAGGAAAAAATSMAAGTTHTPNAISITTARTEAAGVAASLQGGGGTGYIVASADF